LQRWALELQRFNYEIEHNNGEDNIWADLMTRWGAPSPIADLSENRTVDVRRITKATIPEVMRVRPLQGAEFKWPNLDEIEEDRRNGSKKKSVLIQTQKDW
jgi:hypothetical protein